MCKYHINYQLMTKISRFQFQGIERLIYFLVHRLFLLRYERKILPFLSTFFVILFVNLISYIVLQLQGINGIQEPIKFQQNSSVTFQ